MKEDNKKEIKIFRGGGPERYGPERHTSLRTVSFTVCGVAVKIQQLAGQQIKWNCKKKQETNKQTL